jgi:hypothetical protein
MPAILIPILAWFTRIFILRLMVALGVYAGSTYVLNEFFDVLENALNTQMGSLSGVFAQAVTYTGLDQCIIIILSAYSTAISIKGIKSAAAIAPGGGSIT